MGNKIILDVGAMTLEVSGGKVTELSPSQFKILYHFFNRVNRKDIEYRDEPIAYYQDIGFSRGAMKVHMVDIKKLLPEGSYENIRGQGYKLNTRWAWELKP